MKRQEEKSAAHTKPQDPSSTVQVIGSLEPKKRKQNKGKTQVVDRQAAGASRRNCSRACGVGLRITMLACYK
jgi:hypothetical protein